MNLADALEAGRPRFGHPHWMLAARTADGEGYRHNTRPMTLIWSVAVQADGRWWQHVSIAHRDRTPRWEELVEAKEWLCGTTVYAYQVAPPRAQYVNLNEHVLHVFRCLEVADGRVLPEFSGVVDGHRTL